MFNTWPGQRPGKVANFRGIKYLKLGVLERKRLFFKDKRKRGMGSILFSNLPGILLDFNPALQKKKRFPSETWLTNVFRMFSST